MLLSGNDPLGDAAASQGDGGGTASSGGGGGGGGGGGTGCSCDVKVSPGKGVAPPTGSVRCTVRGGPGGYFICFPECGSGGEIVLSRKYDARWRGGSQGAYHIVIRRIPHRLTDFQSSVSPQRV